MKKNFIYTALAVTAALLCAYSCVKEQPQQGGGEEESSDDPIIPIVIVDNWPEKGMEGKTYINNGNIQIGIDEDRGGSIFHFSAKEKTDADGQPRNLVNHYDAGRLIQQSYYGNEDGSSWNGNAWRFNPIQGGGWNSGFGKVTSRKVTPTSIEITSIPVHWATCKLMNDCEMKMKITFAGDYMVKLHYEFTYKTAKKHSVMNQELPAVFCDYSLGKMVYYKGSSPWKGGSLTTKSISGSSTPANGYLQGNSWSEKWAAFVDNDGWGLGIFTPKSTLATYYRVNVNAPGHPASGPKSPNCSYLAPLAQFAVNPKKASSWTYSYNAYLCIGTPSYIRSEFERVK